MNAQEARENQTKFQEEEKERAKIADLAYKNKIALAKMEGKKAAKEELKKIYQKISELSKLGQNKYDPWITKEWQGYGRYYLIALWDEIEKDLIENGYKVSHELDTCGGTIYEGSMDPCAVGWEYSYDYLRLKIEW